MPDAANLAKAQLIEIRLPSPENESSEPSNPEADVTVQFNPETLKVGYSNTMEGGDQSGGSAIQYVSKSSTKLSVELWFDASAMSDVQDVRTLTKKVNHFITPTEQGEGLAPPGIRFLWGSFLFEGVMDSMDETLELFSAEGRPLRAKVSIGITSQEIFFKINPLGGDGAPAPGTTPQSQAQEGDSLQQMMGRSGSPANWQGVAAANGIESPRLLQPGALLDLSASVSGSVTLDAGFESGESGRTAAASVEFDAPVGLTTP